MISRHETVSSVLLPLAVILSTSKSSQNIHGSTKIYKYARYSIRNMLDSMALLSIGLYCEGIPKKSFQFLFCLFQGLGLDVCPEAHSPIA